LGRKDRINHKQLLANIDVANIRRYDLGESILDIAQVFDYNFVFSFEGGN